MARQALHEVEQQAPWELPSAVADTVSPVGPLRDWSSADDHRHSEAMEKESDEDDAASALSTRTSEDLTERVLLRHYMQEVARHLLLGRERESDLARTIREGQEALIGLILNRRRLVGRMAISVVAAGGSCIMRARLKGHARYGDCSPPADI
jgi:DNA-directed RNA polymerase sigma subunit (sigma70/sigma32)